MTLLVIGEAAKKPSLSFKQAHPGTPWAQIIGLRHKLAHHYFLTDADRLWKIAEEDAPALLASLPSRPAPPTPAA